MTCIPCRLRPSHRLSYTETVAVGVDVWDALGVGDDEKRALICIQLPDLGSTKSFGVDSLLCWAVQEAIERGVLEFPEEWQRSSGVTLGDKLNYNNTFNISRSQPIVLQEMFVQALSKHAYTAATTNTAAFMEYLRRDRRILRQGVDISVPSSELHNPDALEGQTELRYRLTMLEPVLQGCIDQDTTSIVILPATNYISDANGQFINDAQVVTNGVEESDDASDDLEIDEGFLASSLGSVIPNDVTHNGVDRQPLERNYGTNPSSLPGHEFKSNALSPGVGAPTGEEYTVYIRTADLPRIGIQDGDWALARAQGCHKSRLVRVKAHDDRVEKLGYLLAPRILLRNLFSEAVTPTDRVILQAYPGGSPLLIPTAQTVTVARVASRVSTNRIYQQNLLQALKDYFDSSKRLITQGDLLAVPIDTRSLLDVQDDEDGVMDENTQSTTAFRADSLEYFVVTSIDSNASGVRHNRPVGDMYVSELGCWVDPSFTRMMQTGVEHIRIPSRRPAQESGFVVNQQAFDQLCALTSAAFAPQASTYALPLSVLLKGPRGTGKFSCAVQVAQSLGMQAYEVNCYDILGANDTKAEGFLRARFDQATSCAPCIIVLRHLDAFAQSTQAPEPGKEPPLVIAIQELFADLYGAWRLYGYPVFVYGTTSEPGRVPPPISACFKHEVEFEVPGEMERLKILKSLIKPGTVAPDVSLQDLARRTAALVAADLRDLVARAEIAATTRVMDTIGDAYSNEDVFKAGIALTTTDFELAMGEARASYSQNIGAPTIPNVSWDDVGGLANVKSEILDTIQLPLEHPELFAQDLKKRSGILLYGPPGTGKTLLAKAVATSCSLNFFSVKGPELLNMYIGESEANVRRVFQRARDARPCVIFFDELDSVAPKRGNHGDSGGVMDRIVSQLLAELDGISAGGSGDVFVIGATNRPDLLDSALLRPGRFDRMLYLGVSDTKEAQLNILKALTRKFKLDPNLDWNAIVNRCTFNFTGADFYALCSDALLKAMSRKAEAIDDKLSIFNENPEAPRKHPIPITPQYYLAEIATPEEIEVMVAQEDFEAALRELTPSVSQSEMEHYARVQQRFSNVTTSSAGETTGNSNDGSAE